MNQNLHLWRNEKQNELRECLIRFGPECFVFRLLSKIVKTKIYSIICLNIILCGLSDHKTQVLKLQSYIAPIQEFTSCYVRNINSFTIDEFQYTRKLNTEIWENIFEGFHTNITFKIFKFYQSFFECFTKSKLNSTHTGITCG